MKFHDVAMGAKEGELFDATELILFIDESGGEHAAEPMLHRCGWGVAALRRQLGTVLLVQLSL
eukprot:6752549-Karenia_brevis.AAC.1